MKAKTITAVAAAFALSATLAFAGPGHEGRGGHGKGGRGEFSAKLAEKLNLTDSQKAQIKTLQEQFRADNAPFRDQSKALFDSFKAAKEANDTAKIEALKPQMEAWHAQMKQRREAQMNRVLSVLTADQRAQFDAMKAEREAKRGQRGERGMRRNNKQ